MCWPLDAVERMLTFKHAALNRTGSRASPLAAPFEDVASSRAARAHGIRERVAGCAQGARARPAEFCAGYLEVPTATAVHSRGGEKPRVKWRTWPAAPCERRGKAAPGGAAPCGERAGRARTAAARCARLCGTVPRGAKQTPVPALRHPEGKLPASPHQRFQTKQILYIKHLMCCLWKIWKNLWRVYMSGCNVTRSLSAWQSRGHAPGCPEQGRLWPLGGTRENAEPRPPRGAPAVGSAARGLPLPVPPDAQPFSRGLQSASAPDIATRPHRGRLP